MRAKITVKDFERVYELDKKERTKEENVEYHKLLNLFKTYDVTSLYNEYSIKRKIKENKEV